MKNKTALEEFAIALYEGGYLQGNGDEIQKLLEHHLEMEKEQMIDFGAKCLQSQNEKHTEVTNETQREGRGIS